MTFAFLVIVVGFLWATFVSGRIPKTGRDGNASGEVIEATITNTNNYADTPVTLRAKKDGRKFKVKMKPTEAHLWIKGDTIEIVLSEDKKNYRVLFNDYFRKNEERIREKAVERLAKAKNYRIAMTVLKYKEDYFEKIKDSSLDSQSIFALISYIKVIDIYTITAVATAVVTVLWKKFGNPLWSEILVPVAVVLLIGMSVYNATVTSNRIIKKVIKDHQK